MDIESLLNRWHDVRSILLQKTKALHAGLVIKPLINTKRILSLSLQKSGEKKAFSDSKN